MNRADLNTQLTALITDNNQGLNTFAKVITIVKAAYDNAYLQDDEENLGPGNRITDATFITSLEADSNWDADGAFTATVLAGIGENDYHYGNGTDNTPWKYVYSQGTMYRELALFLNAFAESPPDVSGVNWVKVNETMSYGNLADIKQGQLWIDNAAGYWYQCWTDGVITRIGGLTGTAIVAAIDATLGNTTWKTGGGGSGGADLITDSAFITALVNPANWDEATGNYTGGNIPAGITQASYYFGVDSNGDRWKYTYSGSTVYRSPQNILDAFAGTPPDASGVSWTTVGDFFAYGPLVGVKKGQTWFDEPNGYWYVSDSDDVIIRMGGDITAGSASGYNVVTVSAALDPVTNDYQVVNSASDTVQTLPAANTVSAGLGITVKRLGTGNVTIARTGGDTIDGAASDYGFDANFADAGASRRFVSNGTDGYIIA